MSAQHTQTGGRPRKYDRFHAEIILKVRQSFEKERQEQQRIHVKKVVERTAAATGASRNIITRMRYEEDVRKWKYDAEEALLIKRLGEVPKNYCSVIRQIVRDVFLEKIQVPTIDTVFEKISQLKVEDVEHHNLFTSNEILEQDAHIWKWSRTTLYNFMKSIGFVYEDKLSHYEHTKNRTDVVSMRDNYLEWIAQYRAEGYRVYYQDETWVFKNMTCTKVWKDCMGNSTDGVYNVPSGKGERSIISHIGCAETLLLDNCLLLFRDSKSNKDANYHTEMNWEVFSHWCETKVFLAIEKTGLPSVVILNRTTYHTVLDEEDRWPVTSWNKKRLSDSIYRWEDKPDG